jgi:hypothetical protein
MKYSKKRASRYKKGSLVKYSGSYANNPKYQAYNKKCYNMMSLMLGRPDRGYNKNTKKFVRIIRYYNTRRYDQGNLEGGAKPIPDALKKLGWIKDDFVEYYKGECTEKKADVTGTMLLLYDYEPMLINVDMDLMKGVTPWAGKPNKDGSLFVVEKLEPFEFISYLSQTNRDMDIRYVNNECHIKAV